ncbi:hypothetical protein CBM2606_A20088 [Cupriavidus taiwanensis]|uniref:hypothetical protein n=1 Tax=Cupriavidus taiwanensis TaxID=164546 RepID=UPI000E161636|nr:hypothetical protein [Cupriavidus taiwanensis]SPA39149.1 hypothetical protein CBM2606_A20088 [Cupriavidus taiwanensis]
MRTSTPPDAEAGLLAGLRRLSGGASQTAWQTNQKPKREVEKRLSDKVWMCNVTANLFGYIGGDGRNGVGTAHQ